MPSISGGQTRLPIPSPCNFWKLFQTHLSKWIFNGGSHSPFVRPIYLVGDSPSESVQRLSLFNPEKVITVSVRTNKTLEGDERPNLTSKRQYILVNLPREDRSKRPVVNHHHNNLLWPSHHGEKGELNFTKVSK